MSYVLFFILVVPLVIFIVMYFLGAKFEREYKEQSLVIPVEDLVEDNHALDVYKTGDLFAKARVLYDIELSKVVIAS